MEEILPGPDVVGEAQRHRRGPAVVAVSVVRLGQGQAERRMWAAPVVLDEHQVEKGVPGSDLFGEAVGLAR
jgi:hypothetical protein